MPQNNFHSKLLLIKTRCQQLLLSHCFHCLEPMEDCALLFENGYISSGTYTFAARADLGLPLKRVYCDMTTDGGG